MTEMSTMSEVSVASTAGQPAEGDDNTFVKIGLVVILFLLIGIVVAVLLRVNQALPEAEQMKPQTTATTGADDNPYHNGGGDDEPKKEDGGGGPPAFVFNPPPPPAPTTKFVRKRTTSQQTTSPTPDQFQEPPRTQRPVPKKLDSPHSETLLCSVSYRAVSETLMPPDGLCDFVIYTEVRFYSRAVRSEYEERGLLAFFNHAKKGTKSRYGASFSVLHAEASLAAMKLVSSADTLKRPWDNNIKDFGMLHVYDDIKKLRDSGNPKLALLQRIRTDQAAKAGGSPKPHLFLGVMNTNFNSGSSSETATMFAELTKRYSVTILVAITHFFRLENSQAAQPPSVVKGSRYQPASLELLGKKLAASGIDKNVIFLTSFTMAVSNFRIDNYGGGLTGRVKGYAPTFFDEVCFLNSSIRLEGDEFAYIGLKQRSLLTFETAQLLISKVGAFFAQYTHARHGVALYDIDYDSTKTGSCASEPFSRIQQLKRYLYV